MVGRFPLIGEGSSLNILFFLPSGHQYLLRFVLQPDKLSLFAPEMMIQFAHFTFDFEKEENGKSKHTFYHLL